MIDSLINEKINKSVFCFIGEAFKKVKSITFKELRKRVKSFQAAMKSQGVQKGDIVVGYMPNSIECLQAKLAAISLGAVWSCASPDFGSTV
jgi:acetoacetyl-CoA synthetase